MHDEIHPKDLIGDILIHAGDWSGYGSFQELTDLNEWFGTLSIPKSNIVLIAGNHDKAACNMGYQITKEMFSNATYLDNDLYEVNGLKIYGTPYSLKYGGWSFMKEESELSAEWAKIPEGIDILIVHGPPKGILDYVARGGNVGSETLRDHIFDRIKPRVVIFGHIHPSYGMKTVKGIKFINAASLNDDYELVNDPIKFTL